MFDLNYQEQKSLTKNLPMPFCFVDLDRFDQNIETVLKKVCNKKVRIATKSVRSKAVLHYLKNKLGDRFSGLMTYSIEESLDLLSHGFDHCLLGYPQEMNLQQGQRYKELKSIGKNLVVMVDSLDHLEKLNELGRITQMKFDVCLDMDLSLKLPFLNFGVFRSPLNTLKALSLLITSLEKYSFVNLVGLMGYEAQIAGVSDKSKNGFIYDFIVSLLKKLSQKKIIKIRASFLSKVSEIYHLDFINGGGSGSLVFTSKDDSVSEVTIGSAFYSPNLFDGHKDFFQPSCGFAIEVSRKPSSNMITCLGGGYIASGACDENKLPKVFSPLGLKTIKNEMFGEVQTPFINTLNEVIDIGDPIFLRHSKAGELLERFNEIYIFKNSKIMDRWKTYRGEGKCYL